MIADTHTGFGSPAPSPQLAPAIQQKLAFKRYSDALAQGDEEEAADAFANWQRTPRGRHWRLDPESGG